tara:strand:- start:709 stop:909 length:201 start_codon:yes stop_codon:yes gene_type:complete
MKVGDLVRAITHPMGGWAVTSSNLSIVVDTRFEEYHQCMMLKIVDCQTGVYRWLTLEELEVINESR